ncbi:MAG TPA: SCO family protein [Blastocatellia bacterium]|nr:SCO family protein [Blastocatellia bacterium]
MKHIIAITLIVCGILAAGAGPGSVNVALARQSKKKQKAAGYYCVMDPEVKASKPGTCPKCGMDLRAIEKDGDAASPDTELSKPNEADSGSPVKLQIPDVSVYDQDGQKLKFVTDLVRGKTVAINFIFTTCTTICPPLAATFRRVQQEMGDRVGHDVRLISISVDPVVDTPERLKQFGAKFKAAPGWTFVTGSKFEINSLLKALGAAVVDKNDHTPMVLVGNDAAGYWTRTYGLAPASVLVRVITDAASKN